MKPNTPSLHNPARLAMAAVLAIGFSAPTLHGQEPGPAPSPAPVAPSAPASAESPVPDSAIPSPSSEPVPAVSTEAPLPLSEPAAVEPGPGPSLPQPLPGPSIQPPPPGPLSLPPPSRSAPPVPRSRVQLQAPPSVPTPVPLPAPAGNGDALSDEDILDIRGPIHIEPPFPWIPWTAGAAGAVLAAFLLWKWLGRPRGSVPPWRLALEKLAASRALMDSSNAQPFSHAVSEIVRSFIEQSFPVRAAHRTTSEFLHDLVKLPNSPLAAHRATLAEFLEYCDLTKFARWSLTLPEMEAMLSKAQSFISSTGQAAAAVPPEQSAPKPATVPEARRA